MTDENTIESEEKLEDERNAVDSEIKGLKTGLQAERTKRQAEEVERKASDAKASKLETELAELRGRFEQSQADNKPKPKEHSRAELQTAVAEGRLTEAEAETILDDQRDRKLQESVRETVTDHDDQRDRQLREIIREEVAGTVEDQTRSQKVGSDIERYTEAIPEISQDGSDARNRLAREYQQLQSLGMPDSGATELAALRNVFGPPEGLKPQQGERETHQETGGSGESDETLRADGIPKGLTARERAFYSERVGPGKLYPDWKAVEDEQKFANPNLRKRMGAR